MRKDWKDELRNSLENFQATEPEGLWSAVQQGLPASRTETTASFALAIALACAAALLIILLPPARLDSELQVLPAADLQLTQQTLPATPVIPATPVQHSSPVLPTEPLVLPAEPQQQHQVSPAQSATQTQAAQAATDEPPTLPDELQQSQPQSSSQDFPEEQAASKDLHEVPQLPSPSSISRRKPAINLIAMASGSLSSQSSALSYGALPGSDIATSLNALSYNDLAYRNFSSLVTSNLGSEVSTRTTHRQPVRFAIEAELMLNKRLGLVSGLCYTRLVSDLTSGGENYYHTVQKLDYLGIPLRLNWHLLDSRAFTFYAGLGTMVEKCVAGSAMTSYSLYGQSLQGEKLSVMDQPLVFSLDTSLGLGIGLWNSASLVIEPGLSWHIPDGGTLRNIYRDRPLNFSLSIALRFSL